MSNVSEFIEATEKLTIQDLIYLRLSPNVIEELMSICGRCQDKETDIQQKTPTMTGNYERIKQMIKQIVQIKQ